MPKEGLSTIENMRMEFADRILGIVRLKDSVRVRVAQELRQSEYVDNAFGNSYWFDNRERILWLHCERLGGTGDLTLCLVHALSHIKVDPENLSGDGKQAFVSEFHRNLRNVTAELIYMVIHMFS